MTEILHLGSFQNYALPVCVSWDPKVSNWIEDGCQVANGIVEKNNDTISCTCDHLGIYGVRVVSSVGELEGERFRLHFNVSLSHCRTQIL